jgi:hypothetical protein
MKHNKQHVKPKATLNKDNFNATTEFNKNINYLFIYFAIFISTFLLYGWTYTFSWGMDDGFIIDILKGIENNWTGISSVFTQRLGEDYRPFTVLSFWLEKTFFGDFNPGHAHLINVAFFGLLLVQIFRFVLNRIISMLQKDTGFRIGFNCSAYFPGSIQCILVW